MESYDELKKFPEITSMEDEAKFTDMIKGIMDRHNNVVPMIARGGEDAHSFVHSFVRSLDSTQNMRLFLTLLHRAGTVYKT